MGLLAASLAASGAWVAVRVFPEEGVDSRVEVGALVRVLVGTEVADAVGAKAC